LARKKRKKKNTWIKAETTGEKSVRDQKRKGESVQTPGRKKKLEHNVRGVKGKGSLNNGKEPEREIWRNECRGVSG